MSNRRGLFLRSFSHDAQRPSLISGFSQKFSQLTWILFKIAGMLCLLLMGISIYHSFRDSKWYIGEVDVPKELVESGYTSKVMARLLMDQLVEIQDEATDSIYAANVFSRSWENKFELEESANQIQAHSWLRSLFQYVPGLPEPNCIRGEWIRSHDQWKLNIRLPQRPLKSFTFSDKMGEENLNIWMKQAASWMIRELEPEIAAFYFLDQQMYDKCLEVCQALEVQEDREDKWWRLVKGLALTQLGDIKGAEQAFLPIAEAEPSCPAVCVSLSELNYFTEDTAGIHRGYLNPETCGGADDLDLLMFLGNRAFMHGQYRRAADMFAQANDQAASNPEVLIAWARALQKSGKVSLASESYARAFHIGTDNKKNRQAYIEFLLDQGRIWKEKERHTQAWATYLKVLQLDPDQREARGVFGKYWSLSDPMYLSPHLSFQLDPDSMSRDVEEGWIQFMIQQGLSQFQQRDFGNAEKWYQRVETIHPDHPGIQFPLIRLYKEQLHAALREGKFGEFRRKYRQLVRKGESGKRIKEDYLPVLKEQIKIWNTHEEHLKVLGAYEVWHEWDKSSAEVLIAWAEVFTAMGNYDQAEEKLIKAYQMNVHLFAVVMAWADMLMHAGLPERAVEKYELADKLQPGNFSIFRKWGKALQQEKSYNDALERYQASLRAIDSSSVPRQHISLFQIDVYLDMAYCAKVNGRSSLRQELYRKAYRQTMQLLAQSPSRSITARGYLLLIKMAAYQRESQQVLTWLETGLKKGLTPSMIPLDEEPYSEYRRKITEFLEEADGIKSGKL